MEPSETTPIRINKTPETQPSNHQSIRDWNQRVPLSKLDTSEKLNLIYTDNFINKFPVTSIFCKHYLILTS